MIDAYVEGVRSIVQACHLVILAPLAMAIVAARGEWHAVAGAVFGVVLGGWIFATRWVVVTDTQLRISAVLVIVALLALASPAFARWRQSEPDEAGTASSAIDSGLGSGWTVAGISAAIAVTVTQWWQPCVGEELGDILTLAPREPWGQLPPTAGFMLGVAMPLVLVGLAFAAWQPAKRIASPLAGTAAAVGIVLAGSVVVGQHGEIVAKLFEWSQ